MEKGNGFSPQNRLKSFGALKMIGNTFYSLKFKKFSLVSVALFLTFNIIRIRSPWFSIISTLNIKTPLWISVATDFPEESL